MSQCRPRTTRVSWALLAYASLAGSSAHAQPTVRIQAAARIELEGIEAGTARGRLVDDLGQPLGDRVVQLHVQAAGQAARRLAARTGEDGRFEIALEVDHGQVELAASFPGDRLLGPARSEGRFDAELAAVRLRFVEPALDRIDLDAERSPLALVAESRLGGAGLQISVRDDAGHTLAEGTTDSAGRLSRELASASFGAPGPRRLVTTVAADATRGAARIEHTVIGYARTRLTLRAQRDDEHAAVEGALSSSRGPLARRAIGLFGNGAHLLTVVTDDQGRYRARVPLPRVASRAPSTLHLQARFESDSAWLAASQSIAVRLQLESASPSPFWLLAPSALCAVLAWRWSRRRKHERARRERRPPETRAPGIHALGDRARGRASSDTLAGVVLDARESQPIAEARVVLEGPDGARVALDVDASGRFASGALARGIWRMTVDAPGHAPQTRDIEVPHRGSWAFVQVLLSNLRWAALEAFRPAAEHVLPSPEVWGQWTVREIRDSAVRSGRSSASLEQASELTELSAYGRALPTPERIDDITRASAEVSRARADSASLRARIPHRR